MTAHEEIEKLEMLMLEAAAGQARTQRNIDFEFIKFATEFSELSEFEMTQDELAEMIILFNPKNEKAFLGIPSELLGLAYRKLYYRMAAINAELYRRHTTKQ